MANADDKCELSRLPVLPTLPNFFSSQPPDPTPRGIVGAKIINFGSAPREAELEGGLIIDYIPAGETQTIRVVLGFNEIAMWIHYYGNRLS